LTLSSEEYGLEGMRKTSSYSDGLTHTDIQRPIVVNGRDKARALSFLHSKYRSENRIEEAAIVGKLTHKEES
jgi:hypothetical protein